MPMLHKSSQTLLNISKLISRNSLLTSFSNCRIPKYSYSYSTISPTIPSIHPISISNSSSNYHNENISESPSIESSIEDFLSSPDWPLYLKPIKILPNFNIPVCQVQFRSYNSKNLDFFVDFAQRAAFAFNMPCSNLIHLPTRINRWTVLKSPFVHKKSQENFERRTHKRLLVIKDSHPDVVEAWLNYLRNDPLYGIGMKATLFSYEKLNFGENLEKQSRGRKSKRSVTYSPWPMINKDIESSSNSVKEKAGQVVKELEKNLKVDQTMDKKEEKLNVSIIKDNILEENIPSGNVNDNVNDNVSDNVTLSSSMDKDKEIIKESNSDNSDKSDNTEKLKKNYNFYY